MISHMAQGKAMTIFIFEMRRQSWVVWLTQETHTLWEAKEGSQGPSPRQPTHLNEEQAAWSLTD